MAEQEKKKDRVGVLLYILYLLMLLMSVVILGKIIYYQTIFTPNKELATKLRPRSICRKIEAARGNILACDGRMLAITYPEYSINLDCTVQEDSVWTNHLQSLSEGLSGIFADKTPAEYRKILSEGRSKGSKYLKLGHPVDIFTLRRIEELPILNLGRYKGGILVSQHNRRHYPYGELGRRTIGFVRDPKSNVRNTHVGLEGKFDYELHGTDGEIWLRESDYGSVQNFDSTYVKPQDGTDILTTLNIDYQRIADQALREGIDEDDEIEAGCVVLMDVETGAIRAMVNLTRDPQDGKLKEISNLAIGRLGEPGSVFKSTCLMIMLENDKIKSLSETIPTNKGILNGFPYESDEHITDYERAHGNQIPIIEGFKVSSNYMFRYLAYKNYGSMPEKYLANLYTYRLGEAFDFDLEGLATPQLPDPKSPGWSKTDLTGIATGYAVNVTPLHILTFYNAIANGGKMPRPYLVEGYGNPSILNANICSKATADTLTRALKSVIEEGTAKRLRGAKCSVAGKTGTARVALETGGYFVDGRKKKNQGTFVGFFPAEKPRYSIICTIYSKLSERSFYGGTIPAGAVRKIVDRIYDIDPCWQAEIASSREIPSMESPVGEIPVVQNGCVRLPSLQGMGLKDALYLIENCGLKCNYSGIGHVTVQEPAAGTQMKKGETVKIELR